MAEQVRSQAAAEVKVAILAAKAARSCLSILDARCRSLAALHWKQVMSDIESLRIAIGEAWPQ